MRENNVAAPTEEDGGQGMDVISLVDEEGVEHEFEIADVMELDGGSYMALIPMTDNPDDFLNDPGELVILKVTADDAEEYLEAIEDEDEFNKISGEFIKRLSEEYDFIEGEES